MRITGSTRLLIRRTPRGALTTLSDMPAWSLASAHASPTAPRHRVRRTPWAAAVVVISGFALASCTVLPSAPTPAPDASESAPEQPQQVAAPEFFPEGSATENEPYFEATLLKFSSSEEVVRGEPIVDALAAAGFQKTQMQVSFDQSRTGLIADSILVSVLIGTDCLIGQVVTQDRSVTTTLAPALTDAQNICLIGNTRPIDW